MEAKNHLLEAQIDSALFYVDRLRAQAKRRELQTLQTIEELIAFCVPGYVPKTAKAPAK
jgi:hypothetical protein